jgi:threonine/homoserine/homoserine lactone efflux protein
MGNPLMIAWKTIALFLATVLPLVCTPGPDILFISSQALAARHRGAILATTGVCAGYLVHAALAILGLAAIIAASAPLFEAIRWIGAAYLVYLGLKLLYSSLSGAGHPLPSELVSGLLWRGMMTSLLNPKGLLFFLALLPQFVDLSIGQVALQTLVLSLIFVGACLVVYLGVGLAVSTARQRFRAKGAGRAANGIAGTILTLLGIRLALVR